MARVINGLFSGKLGNMVYYIKNGRQMVREKARPTKEPSPAQLRTRAGLKVVVVFIKHLTEFVGFGFPVSRKNYTKGKSGYNLAVSCNIRSALTYEEGDPAIDYSKVFVAHGSLLQAISPEVIVEAEGLRFSWLCPGGLDWSCYSDQVMMLVYFPDQQQTEYIVAGAKRSACSDWLPLSAEQTAQRMEIYISFISENRKAAAKSTYLGRIN